MFLTAETIERNMVFVRMEDETARITVPSRAQQAGIIQHKNMGHSAGPVRVQVLAIVETQSLRLDPFQQRSPSSASALR